MNDDRFKLVRAVRAAALAREVEYLARQSLRPPLADGEGSAGSRMQEPSPSMPISNFLMHSNSSNLAPLRQPSPTPPALPEPALNPAKRRRLEDDDHGTAAALLGLSSPWMSPLLTGTSPLLMGVNLEKCVSLLDTPDLVGLGTPLNGAALPPPLPTVQSSDVSLCASPSLQVTRRLAMSRTRAHKRLRCSTPRAPFLALTISSCARSPSQAWRRSTASAADG